MVTFRQGGIHCGANIDTTVCCGVDVESATIASSLNNGDADAAAIQTLSPCPGQSIRLRRNVHCRSTVIFEQVDFCNLWMGDYLFDFSFRQG